MKTNQIKVGQKVYVHRDFYYTTGVVSKIHTDGGCSDWATIRFDNGKTGCYDIRDLHLDENLDENYPDEDGTMRHELLGDLS